MLTILNNYAHGYIAIPIILACKKHGLFKILNLSKPFPFTDLVKELKANSGYLRAALHMLESLNWVSRNSKDQYLRTPGSDIHHQIPSDITKLMSFPMNDYLNKNQEKHRLKKWIEMSSQRWDIGDPKIANFLDGMLVIPLLLALKENNLLRLTGSDNQKAPLAPLCSKLNPAVREEITAFFSNQGWLSQKKGVASFTDTGRFIVERIFITAAVASYRPMLTNISEVIFGDCQPVFERDLPGSERHVARTLNVIASGFQHEKYFSDMEEIFLSIFNCKPYAQQPKYIADMGCGDGTLLKKIYEIIKNKSLRGSVLHEYPVKLIGIDSNEKVLQETARTLKDIDHLVLKGDIGNPEQMIKDLKKMGIRDTENILHVRSFLDHDRPYIPPLDTSAEKARSNIPDEAVYVDREGNSIPATFVMQNLIEHLKRWSSVIGRHGLIILEDHCLEPKTVNEFIDKCETLHFDAYHRFSQQLLVEAHSFLMAAAEAGLFPHQDFFRKYPRILSFSRITLNLFERKEYRVRYAHENDLPALVELEKQCWAPGLRRPGPVLKRRLKQYPEGQLVLEMGNNNKVVGAVYSQRIADPGDLKTASMKSVERLHRREGPVVQLLAVNILPEMQNRNLGDQLLEFMLQQCSLMSGIHQVIGITRCKDYHKYADTTPQEYINRRNQQGRLVDTNLRFHQLHGAQIKGLVANYRPKDGENKGYGVLVEYDINHRRRDDIQVNRKYTQKKEKKETVGDIISIKEFIVKTVSSILGIKEENFPLQRPLMEMGLDSAHLLELNEQVRYRYQIPLEPAFFFEYNTGERIISYLQEHVDLVEGEEVTKMPGTTAASQKQGNQPDRSLKNGTNPVSRDSSISYTSSAQRQDIAVVGVACRLPGDITNKEQLWELLSCGKDAINKMPGQRWQWPANITPDKEHIGIDRGGFLEDITNFDASFFHISPKEAEIMDPQQRLLLELSWECLEDAGYPAKAVFGSKTGVFIGASGSDYNTLLNRHFEKIAAHFGTGNSMAVLPNRVSYFYDFFGPSILIDTACSSSLVAVHEAVKSLQVGECTQALVGGINIMCHPATTITYYKAGMLAKDGRCKTFDKEANGYVRGEGGIIIFLKPLAQAACDQDNIYAVIKGSAINHGGQASGLTVPNPAKQSLLLVEAYKTAGVGPETVGYIEAHGTGTSLGDPIEISGLKEAFSLLAGKKEEVQKPYCGLGSIKTNIGHLEAAAGIAGLLKVVLSLQHQRLPASLNFNELNPHITLAKTPFYIVDKKQPWQLPRGQLVRRAGVSSFGFGGANAHVVLEEAPPISLPSTRPMPCGLICLSAKTGETLQKKQQDLAGWLEKEEGKHHLADISATLLLGREHFDIRAAFVVKNTRELHEKLKEVLKKGKTRGYFKESNPGKEKPLQLFFEEFSGTMINRLQPGKIKSQQEYRNKLMALAELYTRGYELDWKLIYTAKQKHNLSLPTYPFAGKRYWVPGPAITAASREKSQLSISPLSLPSITAAGEIFSDKPQKSKGGALQLKEELKTSLANALNMNPNEVNVDEKFVNMGLDSIIGVEWIQTINQQYGTSIKAIKVYDYPTFSEFSRFFEKELTQKMETAVTPSSHWKRPSPGAIQKPRSSIQLSAGFRQPTTPPVVDLREIEPGIVQLIMQDRLHKNRFSRELVQGLIRSFESIRADSSCKVVILTGYDGYFASGGTKEGLLAIHEGKAKFIDMKIFNLPLDCNIPVIAAMQGHSVGAGWSMGMFCDFVVMSRESVYTSNYMKFGFTPGAGATLIFPEKFGISLAQEILFTGKTYRGKELESKGVPFPVLPAKEVLPYAIKLAKTLSRSPRESLIILKDHMADSIRKKVRDTYEKELKMHEKTFVNQPEVKERIQSFFDQLPENRGEKSSSPKTTQQKIRIQDERYPLIQLANSTKESAPPGNTPETCKQKMTGKPAVHSLLDSIAIIGMSGQFPKSKTLAAFWDNLARARDCIEEIPAHRWSIDRYYSPDPGVPGKTNCKWMGVLEDADKFDDSFFNISPAEARWMDPQQRLFLENCWHCIEDAGLSPGCLTQSRCGVFVGCGPDDYHQFMSDRGLNARGFIGGSNAILGGRISYILDLKGPCLAIDTACSSSLVAIAEACNSLVLHSSDLALSGGVCVMVGPSMHIMTGKAGMLSKDGRCFTFDNRANGFVPGEGVGVILLKRLDDAVRDGDHIYGVIRGWGINQDGKTNGITAPSMNSQILLEKEVYQRFNINPETISLVEAHGTGTKLGDPIEVEALIEAFQSYTQKKHYCALGSVKSNIGHLVTAAGAAGVIKVLLALQHRMLPATIHFKTLNEHISLDNSPFYINTGLKPWETAPGMPRRAAVSSFGFSGTNAHIVIEEYLPPPDTDAPLLVSTKNPILFVLSANSTTQLKIYAGGIKSFIESHQDLNLADMAYTLQVGREAMDHRLAFLADSREALIKALAGFIDNDSQAGVLTARVKRGNDGKETFAADEDSERLLKSWMQKKKLDKITGLWLKGLKVDWNRLYSDRKPRRISLPTYPFARERYWVPETRGKAAVSVTAVPAAAEAPGASLHPLMPQNNSACQEKTGGISLRPLSDYQTFSITKPAAQKQQSVTLSSESMFFSQPGVKEEANPGIPVQADLTAKLLKEELTTSLAKALEMKPADLGVDKKFLDMGLDSINGMEWIQEINLKYGISITATSVYDYPTLREFVVFLKKELKINGGGLGIKEVENPSTPISQIHEIESVRGEYRSESSGRKECIAIVGMSGRYPDASHLNQYWDNLVQAKNSIREIPGFRWDVNRYYDPRPLQKGKVNCKWLGLLEGIEYFDPLFFNIPPAEAALMDPQHRLFLQEGYKAFEDAGYNCQLLSNQKCGVYLGIMSNEYGLMLAQNQLGLTDTTGNSFAIAAARLPYYLNLKGPAIPIDTACSSSLTATHLACQALLNHEIDMALVGGVSLYLTPGPYIGMCAAGMLSPQGQCKPFDDSADGFVPGEGAGALVLKRLTGAQADGDSIYGVIIGSGINHDGKTNGITAPSRSSQIQLEREIYDKYQIYPRSIGYIETHGTGTKLGDLIELEALSTVFKEKTDRKNYCALGSVKGNIGHTSAAAGVASIQKVLLGMKHKKLVPTLNFTKPNEYFDFEDSPFYVNTRLRNWEVPPATPRRAGVSSFGFSGTNVHIVIEEPHGMGDLLGYAPSMSSSTINLSSAPSHMNSSSLLRANSMILFILSAKSKEQLEIYAGYMKRFIESHQDLDLADMAYTLQLGREPMDHRLAVLVDSREALINALEGFINNNPPAEVLTARVKRNEEGVEEFAADVKANTLLQNLIGEKKLEQVAALWVKGLNVDWHRLYGDSKSHPPRRISLPTYPFARERCWIPGIDTLAGSTAANPVFTPETYIYGEPFLEDHTIHNRQVLIGVTHGSLALNAFFKLFPEENRVHLHRLDFVKPIEVDKNRAVEVLVKTVQKGSNLDFQVVYREVSSAAWNLTAAGNLQKTHLQSKKIDLESIKDSLAEYHHLDRIYTVNPAIGLGDSFKTITHLYTGKERALARVTLTQAAQEENHRYVLHPLITNSAFLAIFPLIEPLNPGDAFLPFGIKDIHFWKTNGLDNCWVLVKLVKYSGEMIVFDAEVVDEEFRVVVHYSGCSLKRLRAASQFPGKDRLMTDSTAPQPHSRETAKPLLLETRTNKTNRSIPGKIQKYLMNKLAKIVPHRSTLSHLEFNLMDMGLKSSQLVELTNEITKETGIELFPALFFEYPNIKELTEFFSREHQDSFIGLWGSPAAQPGGPKAGHQTMESIPPPPARTSAAIGTGGDDIAVIGMFGMFAEASDLDRFWNNLRDKKDVIKEIPLDHWDYRPWYEKNPEAQDKTYCKWGSFIEDVDKFDAEFFNISPREAEWMDPQLRLLLQSVYAAGDDAGYINRLRGTAAGVFVGVCCHDYADRITELNLPMDPYLGTGNTQTVIANRVSFYFDFTGPSIAIDTACSSSLFALHYACQALRSKECATAFVSGVNLLLSPVHYRYFSSLGVLSPTGRCHTFDEAADGYVPGEGIATILLKPLEQAKRDGDRIHAIIKGSAALHGGYTPSLTAPGVAGEENVILKAWENAGVHPETLSYIEAHGTGTKLGDPIEVTALTKAFERFTDKERFCAIGSAKSNIGHTEGTAGIAGVLKVILQMKHRQIPALPQFKKLNPHIQLEKSALYLQRELEEWKSPAGVPRRAGVNSFGFSGAYAHVVLEEYIPEEPERPPITIDTRDPAIIVLSAKNEERLREQVQRLLAAIASPGRKFSDTHLMDMAYTLQVGREAMEERLAVTVTSIKELQEKLNAFLEGRENSENLYRGQVKRNKETLAVFAADEDLQQIIDTWFSKRKYAKLLDLWVKGLTVDWNKLYGDHKTNPYQPRRIGLPPYPFARKRYWLAALDAETGLTAASSTIPVSSTRSPSSLPPENAAQSTFASPPAKPTGIPLQPLSSPTSQSLSITPPGANPEAASQDHAQAYPPAESLQEELKTSLAKVLYINSSEVDMDKKFIEMGLDSIVCLEWVQVINKQYGTGIAATRVYDYPTLGEFAGFLAKELKVLMTTPKPSPIPVASLQEELNLSLGRVLSMERDDINADDEFVEIGLDAVLGMEWLQAINQQYGTSITPASIHDYPTLRQFAGFLEKELNQERGDLTTASLKTTPSLSLDELIDQVQQGTLDCQQADRLFHQLDV